MIPLKNYCLSYLTCRPDCVFVRAELKLSKVVFQNIWRDVFIASHWLTVVSNMFWTFWFVISRPWDVKSPVIWDKSWSARNAFLFASKTALRIASFLDNIALSVSFRTSIGSTSLTACTFWATAFAAVSTFSSTAFAALLLTSINMSKIKCSFKNHKHQKEYFIQAYLAVYRLPDLLPFT